MKPWFRIAAVLALVFGGVALAWDSLGLPDPFRVRRLVVGAGGGSIGGDLTVSGDAGVTGHASIAGNLNVTGFVRGGDAGFHNVVQSGDHFVSGYSGLRDAGTHNVAASGDLTFAGLIATSSDLVADSIATDGSGNGSATVPNNSLCYCSPTSAPVNVCNRSGTTLTVQAGVASDPVQFFCIVKL